MKSKSLLLCLLAGAVFVMAGCGKPSLDDEFIFGKNRISRANETITIEVPFEMGVSGQLADLAPKDAETVHAEGHNKYMQILVSGEAASGKSAESLAEHASALMKDNPAVSNLSEVRDSVRIGEIPAIRLGFSFTDNEKGRSVDLTVKEYIFQRENTLWRVIYQYRSADPVGKALTERVEGKIVSGATF